VKLGRGATWLAVLVLLVGPAVLVGAGPAAASGGLSVTVGTLTPAVGTSGSTLQVAGAVTNRGSQVVHKVSIRLRMSQGALGSRSELAAVAAGEVTSRDGTVVVEAPLGDLAPGGSEPFDLRQALADVPALTGFGVYVLGIEVVGTRGAQTGRLDITRTLLPWVPASPGLSPTGFSWLWPLVGAPVRLADGTFADDSLAAALAPGGRLDRLLAAGTRLDQDGAAVTWALDPELVESVGDMADGYRVRTPAGGTVPGGGAGLAQRWLADLRSATEGADVLALPYGDVDVAALVHQDMPSDVARARTAGAAALAGILPAVSTVDDLAWPADGYLDRAGLATLVRSGVSSVVLDGRALPPTIDLSYTPSGRAQVSSGAGRVKALLADPGLADLLGSGARARGSDGVLAAQRVVAETAMIASELPGGGTPRTIVAMPPRRWDPSQEFLDQLAPVASAPWAAPMSLRALAETAPPEVDRGPLHYPAAERRVELPGAYLKGIADMKDSISNFAAVLTDKTQMVPGLQASVLRLESTYWRGRVDNAGNRKAREQTYLGALKRKVYVQGGSFTFGSHSGTIPVTVVNELPQQVVVDLRLEPQTPRLRLDPVDTRPIGPNQKVQVEVRAHAVAGGPVSVAATLHTPSGAQYGGQVAQLQVNVTQIGTVALVITVGAAAVLFLAAGIRVVRRVRHGTDGGPATGRDDGLGDDGRGADGGGRPDGSGAAGGSDGPDRPDGSDGSDAPADVHA
jgi:hypothetical protein